MADTYIGTRIHVWYDGFIGIPLVLKYIPRACNGIYYI